MPLIDNLITLYNVDRQVRSLRSRVESAEIYLNLQKRQMEEIEVERAENDRQRKQRNSNVALIETETGSIDERIELLRDELNQAVNDKQYSALLAEMNTIKDRLKAFEDDELIELAAIEELDKTASDITMRTEEREKVLQVAQKELDVRQSEISQQLAELEVERATAAAIIPQDTLVMFDEIADDYDGEAMASIEIIDLKRREYSCNSCSLRLPLDAITTLLSTSETLVTCVSCDRILYLESETREAMVPNEK